MSAATASATVALGWTPRARDYAREVQSTSDVGDDSDSFSSGLDPLVDEHPLLESFLREEQQRGHHKAKQKDHTQLSNASRVQNGDIKQQNQLDEDNDDDDDDDDDEAIYDPLAVHGGGEMSSTGRGGFSHSSPVSSTSSATPSKPSPSSSSASSTTAVNGPSTGMSATTDMLGNAVAGDGVDEAWKVFKPAILQKYTTKEQITVSFIKESVAQPDVESTDSVKHRLEQLDDTPENAEREILHFTQKEYVSHIETLHAELARAWDTEQRVKSLKIAIQCAKLLADTSVVQFYPSKFVLVTELLDTFGKLVYRRIRGRAVILPSKKGGTPQELPDDFTPDMVPPIARETCRNWFFKIASIRELLPRLYIEIAILSCYRYLSQTTYDQIVHRLCSMVRGIGDPLVAAYAWAYLARKGREVVPNISNEYLHKSLADHLSIFHRVRFSGSSSGQNMGPRFRRRLKAIGVDLPQYMNLISPAIEWLVMSVAVKPTEESLHRVLAASQSSGRNAVLLQHVMHYFPSRLVSSRASTMTNMIVDCDAQGVAPAKLFAALGACLVQSPPDGGSKQFLVILNEVWAHIVEMQELQDYLSCAHVWIEFALQHFTLKQVDQMLGNVLNHVVSAQNAALTTEAVNTETEEVALGKTQIQEYLLMIVTKIIMYHKDFNLLLAMTHFLPLLDTFEGVYQVQANKCILEAFVSHSTPTSDPMIINAMFGVGKVVHDSINTLSFSDEVRQISKLISGFVLKIRFGRDVEKNLNFFVECRRAFCNLDSVKAQLVLGVTELAMRAHRLVGGKHTKRTAAFLRACIAYCYITIPSMDDEILRLRLYTLASQISLANSSFHQGESLIKAAIQLISNVPVRTDSPDGQTNQVFRKLVTEIAQVCNLLVVAPGHPADGKLSLVTMLVDTILGYPWPEQTGCKSQCLISVFPLLASLAQSHVPLYFESVEHENNSLLSKGGSDFLPLLQELIQRVTTTLISDLEILCSDNPELCSSLALRALHELTSRARLDRSSANTIVALNKFVLKSTDEHLKAVQLWHDAMLARRVDASLDPMAQRILSALAQ
eukprot:CAMPEP_0174232350 /NCGR_PEP_ID=MMETSP0417-20130205/2651_1 /TAXON_ID=242541 /ORGANISM="Mayorella sp, Strain BSH-02190019" /LENGTH=1061 /DNA_ID=CAMNT_0015310381 /DNA_START=13 /DNA_END=3198 /DNA_ORIENTATION=-